MKKSEIIFTVIFALVTIGITIAIIITLANTENKPDVTTDPASVTETTVPGTDDVIPPPPQDVTPPEPNEPAETIEQENGEIHLDIGERNDNGHEDAPGVVGEVVVIPGIKEAEHEEND